MNNDKLKTINWVGVGAAVLAFICVFLPFCSAKVTVYGYSITQDSCNFVTFNVMGVLFMLVTIAAGGLYFLAGYKGNKQFDKFALIASAAALVFLILALIIGNGDIKSLKEYGSYVSVSYAVGMYFEFILAAVMIGAKWIDELVVKKYIFKNGQPQQGQYMGQASQPNQYMNQQPQQGQYMGGQQSQSNQYMNQQPQQGQYMGGQAPQPNQYMNQQPQQNQNNNNMQ